MCATNRLQRLLLQHAGPSASIASATSAEWSSITFSGHRHQVCMMFTNKDEADKFEEFVKSEPELELPGCILTELSVLESDEIVPLGHAFITVEALTLND